MKLSEICRALEQIAPLALAEPWDNVGLLAGDPSQDISRILLTIDYTAAVAAESKTLGCDLVVAYHPPIFQAIKRLTASSLIFDAIRRGVAIYSPHTAFDAADGGTNDVLADAIGLESRQPLKTAEAKATQYKLVVFVPAEHAERVGQAIFDAGAGQIGNYQSCSFRMPGTGTFFGGPGTNPTVGQAGRLERVEEIRLETVVPIDAVDSVIRALRQSHPYEEPAFDLNVLAGFTSHGPGRIGVITPTPLKQIVQTLKAKPGLKHLLVAGAPDAKITKVAICAGAGAGLLDAALAGGANLFLTGELRHHEALRAVAAGMSVICCLHSNSERIALGALKASLEKTVGMPEVILSQVDRDPFQIE